jgi:hypothetical protein
MTRQAYNDYRGWKLPDNERGDDMGYLVEYLDGGEANDSRHDGYISWSPEAVFSQSYKSDGFLSFGHALVVMGEGKRVYRHGWNGKGQFVYMVPAASYPAQRGAAKAWAGEDAMIPYGAYLAIQSVSGTVHPWTASNSDALAHDWAILDQEG